MTSTKPLRRLSVLLALLLLLAACGSDGGDDASSDTTSGGGGDTTAASIPDGPTIVIRGQDFSESATIAQVYGQYLQGLGYDVEIQTPAGFRTEAIDALGAGDLNLIVDYIGGAQAELAPEEEPSADPSQVMTVISPLFTQLGATVLDFSPATDGDALVVRGDSEATTISDLAELDYVFGAAAQCYERPQCYIGLTDPEQYGIEFASTETIEFGPLLGEALAAEEVDAVIWNTTAPQIEEEGFKVLEDDLGLFPAQNIAPIIETEVLRIYGDPLRFALNDLSAALTTEDLLAWNAATDLDFEEPDAVAAAWLEENGYAT
jgi:osmoprotectant transport system substrate-binding protein